MTTDFRKINRMLPRHQHHEGTGFAVRTMQPMLERCSGRIFSEEDKSRIRQEYSDGKLQKVLAKENGVSQMTISNICRGVIRKNGRRMVNEEEKSIIRNSFSQGMTLKSLAALHNLTPQGVSYICRGVKREKGWKYRPGRRLRNEEKIKIRDEFSDGKTHAELAEKFKTSETTIQRACKGIVRKRIPKRLMRISEKKRDKIRKEYTEGELQKYLAKRFHLSTGSVSNICKDVVRLRGRKRRRTVNEVERAQIRIEYSEGRSQRKLANKHNISPSQIAIICKGVERRELPKECKVISEEQKIMIRSMYADGFTQKSIAEKAGVSKSSVFKLCKGVERNKEGGK